MSGVVENQLLDLRKARGLTIMGVCALSGCGTATIVRIEKYDHYPTEDVRERLADALEVSEKEIWPDRE